VLDFPWSKLSTAIHFDHNYSRKKRRVVPKKQQTERFAPDHSQRIYGYGGLMPRFARQGKARRRLLLADVRVSLEMMRELLERQKDWDGDPHDT
jgi:gentisate 1,2-dioxygenase